MSIITKVQGGVKEGALKKLHVEPQDNSNDEWYNGHIPHPNVPPDFIAQDGIGWWFMMF